MERCFRVRLDELLDDAHVPPTLLRGVLPRLQTFLQPFLDALQTPQQQTNAHHYVQGLLSELDSKDVESIAYLHDRERQRLSERLDRGNHRPSVNGTDLIVDRQETSRGARPAGPPGRRSPGRLAKAAGDRAALGLRLSSSRDDLMPITTPILAWKRFTFSPGSLYSQQAASTSSAIAS